MSMNANSDPVHATIKRVIDEHPVVLFMKGEPNAPECGFSATIVSILNYPGAEFVGINVLKNPATYRRDKLHLTDNDVASRIESKLLEPLSVNLKKGATGRQRTWRPIAKARLISSIRKGSHYPRPLIALAQDSFDRSKTR
jgi:hypothetical protein